MMLSSASPGRPNFALYRCDLCPPSSALQPSPFEARLTLLDEMSRTQRKTYPAQLYLLTDEYDFSCTPEDTARTAARIPGAKFVVMKELGHFPMSENWPQFRRYILPVLDEIAALSP